MHHIEDLLPEAFPTSTRGREGVVGAATYSQLGVLAWRAFLDGVIGAVPVVLVLAAPWRQWRVPAMPLIQQQPIYGRRASE